MSSKGNKLPAEPLTRDEVHAILKQCSARAPTGIRNRALITVLYRAGLRISEALDLLPKDIDAAQCTILVRHGKGDKRRLVGIDPEAMGVIQRWLDKRAERGFNGKQPVFCTLKGEPMWDAYVRSNLLPRLGRKAGIEKRVHCHGFRHAHATELRREGVDIGVISQQLGHSNIATTVRYLRHLMPVEVINTMKARQWSAP